MINEQSIVTPSAFSAIGLVIESQKALKPCENAFSTTAASGIRTIRLR
jgi:hypothetical protein